MSTFPTMTEKDFENTYPEIHQQVCEELGMGFVPNLFRCVAAIRPDLALSSWQLVRNNLCHGNLPRITKELMFSYIAHKKECDYCHIAHHAIALQYGFAGEDIKAIVNNHEQIHNPVLRNIIKFSSYSVDNSFSDISEMYDQLIKVGFSIDEIAELIGMVSCALYMVNIANSLALSIDEPFEVTIRQASA